MHRRRRLKITVWRDFPFTSLSLHLPSLPFLLPSLLSFPALPSLLLPLPLPSPILLSSCLFPLLLHLVLMQLESLWSAVSSPSGSGRSQAAKRFWCIFRLKSVHLLSLATLHICNFFYTFWLCTTATSVEPDACMQTLTHSILFEKKLTTKFLKGRLEGIASTSFWPWGRSPIAAIAPHGVGAYGRI